MSLTNNRTPLAILITLIVTLACAALYGHWERQLRLAQLARKDIVELQSRATNQKKRITAASDECMAEQKKLGDRLLALEERVKLGDRLVALEKRDEAEPQRLSQNWVDSMNAFLAEQRRQAAQQTPPPTK